MKKQRYPKGWSLKRIQEVIAHYDNQTEDEAVAEDEAAWNDPGITIMAVPTELVPEIGALIARRNGDGRRPTARRKRKSVKK